MENSSMRLCVLIENTSGTNELAAEHGLSLAVQHNNRQYLIDAGASGAAADNALKLNINLAETEAAFLSHGHYDHAGGFARILKENPEMKVYCGKNALGEYYSEKGEIHYIGVPSGIKEAYAHRFSECENITELGNGVYIVPHMKAADDSIRKISANTGMLEKKAENYVYDTFEHEISVVFDTAKGLVIINSCSHGGLINIIREVRAAVGNKTVYAYAGGLHMKAQRDGCEVCAFSDEEVRQMADFVAGEQIKRVITGHCTGDAAFKKLAEYIPLERLESGKIISI